MTLSKIAAGVLLASTVPLAANAADSIPSVIVTIENEAPARGALQTPFWIAAHDGSFDIYDRNVPLGANDTVAAPAVERLAEDGDTGPLSAAFALSNPTSPQGTVVGPAGPFAPGDRVSFTLNVDPSVDQYFSYASMVIPSNDAFIANGSPLAHRLFNNAGRFVGRNFVVAGSDVLDAGTELNDEYAPNTAFLNQGGPDIGDVENGNVVLHGGFNAAADGDYPNGVLTHPVFGNADFTSSSYRAASFRFSYIDLAANQNFESSLSPRQEVVGTPIDSRGRGTSRAIARDGDRLAFRLTTGDLSSPIVGVHLHNAQRGANGPLVVDLTSELQGNRVVTTIEASDVTGPLAGAADPMVALLNQLVAGNIYINVHTSENPGGEIRGQIELR